MEDETWTFMTNELIVSQVRRDGKFPFPFPIHTPYSCKRSHFGSSPLDSQALRTGHLVTVLAEALWTVKHFDR